MKNKRTRPEINTGSIADIAFLLLIFFLVATTINSEIGIQRKLPKHQPEPGQTMDIHDRNILKVELNAKDEILVEGEYSSLKELKSLATAFIDNNGKGICAYCLGAKNPSSSDSPEKAVISIQNNRNTSYNAYVAVQNELTAAYNKLREREALLRYNQSFEKLKGHKKKEISNLYPIIISEAQAVDLASN